MRGTQLTVNMVTGQATLGAGGPKTPGTPGGRVQAVFIPNSDANSSCNFHRSLSTNRHDFCHDTSRTARKSARKTPAEMAEDGLRVVEGGKGLVVTRIGKSFNKRPVVRSVSLSFKRGEAVGFWAPTAPARPPAST